MSDGVIVGADSNVEWLIPWWWMNYSLNNTYPVTFINFGSLSTATIDWCKKRGQVVEYRHPEGFNIVGKDDKQTVWIKKPFAMLQSPYERTIWFDLDCWIRDSIKDLFSACENAAGLGIVKEQKMYQVKNLHEGHILQGETIYNAGVVVYKKGSEMMKLWTEELIHNYHHYYADQDTLSRLLSNSNIPFTQVNALYNWVPYKENREAKVIHLVGKSLKEFIKVQMLFLKTNLDVHFP